MTAAEAAEVLTKYNTWRRGDTDHLPDWVTPKAIGIALEIAIINLSSKHEFTTCPLCGGEVIKAKET